MDNPKSITLKQVKDAVAAAEKAAAGEAAGEKCAAKK